MTFEDWWAVVRYEAIKHPSEDRQFGLGEAVCREYAFAAWHARDAEKAEAPGHDRFHDDPADDDAPVAEAGAKHFLRCENCRTFNVLMHDPMPDGWLCAKCARQLRTRAAQLRGALGTTADRLYQVASWVPQGLHTADGHSPGGQIGFWRQEAMRCWDGEDPEDEESERMPEKG